MQLHSIRLRNFRQHVDTAFDFQTGITGLIGPNGAGKTTILEAFGWSIYGTSAARGTVDTIRWSKAPNRARVEVESRFAIAGHTFRVVRTLHHADCYMDGGEEPVASGKDGVTAYLEKKIGMSREEFFSAYLTPQKELEFLAGHKGLARGHFLSRVLGYDRLRDAQERNRKARSALRAEIDALRRSASDPAELRNAKLAAEQALTITREHAAAAAAERDAAALRLGEVAPQLAGLEDARRRHESLRASVASARKDVTEGERSLARAEAEISRIATSESDIRAIEKSLESLPAKQAEAARLDAASRAATERSALLEQKADLEREIASAEARLVGLRKAPALLEKYAADVARLEREVADAERTIETERERWTSARQEAAMALSLLDARIRDLGEHLARIESAGHDGACTTCERPLGSDFGRVRADLRAKLEDANARRPALAEADRGLQKKPDALRVAERTLKDLQDALSKARTKKTRCEEAVPDLSEAETAQAGRTARLTEVDARLAALPSDYHAATHALLRKQIEDLQASRGRLASLRETVARRPEFEADAASARTRIERGHADQASATQALEQLAFSEEAFAALKAEFDHANEARSAADVGLARAQGAVRLAEEHLHHTERALAEAERRAAEITELEEKIQHHNELDVAFMELRRDLNDRIRPELADIASGFMAELTDGCYTGVDLDESYEIRVIENGEVKPVVSGGEEDLANLVLRLSLSQLIAERAGHPLGLLILDEVFGSLDRIRRDNVMTLLRKLQARFEQIILITHVEEIQDGLDQLIVLKVDPETGATRIIEGEVPDAPDAEPTVLPGRRSIAAA